MSMKIRCYKRLECRLEQLFQNDDDQTTTTNSVVHRRYSTVYNIQGDTFTFVQTRFSREVEPWFIQRARVLTYLDEIFPMA